MYRCLVVGDGNFSYSLSLSKTSDFTLVATSYETQEQVSSQTEAADNVSELSRRGVLVLYKVDGTCLERTKELTKGLKFHRIIFNFPHTGGKSDIGRNRQLLKDFFISAANLLEAPLGEVHVSLCKGQGGTPADCQERGYENSWKIVEMAAEGGLVLTAVKSFKGEEYPGYSPSGYRGQGLKGFVLEGALTHVFSFPGSSDSLYPPSYSHDVSFWCQRDQLDHAKLKEVITRETENMVESVSCIDTFEPSDDPNRVSYCYRIVYCSRRTALSRTKARELQLKLRATLEQEMNVELR